MNALGVRPSFATGFAQGVGESEYPELWRGLVAAYDPSLGQTGGRLVDWSGKGNHGTFVNDVSWLPTPYGSGLDFPGTKGNYVNCGTGLNQPAQTGKITIICYFNNHGDGYNIRNHSLIGKYDNTINERAWNLMLDPVFPDEVALLISSDGVNYRRMDSSDANFSSNQWYQLAATYDGTAGTGGYRMYLNDRLLTIAEGVSSGDPAGIHSNNIQVQIGAVVNQGNQQRELDSQIGYTYIYNRVLIPAEISLIHQLRKQVA